MSSPAQLTLPHRPLILGIAGCSGSGKTTLARELAAQLDATLLSLDFYYRDLSHLSPAERAVHNFDHPDSLEVSLLVKQVQTLAAGTTIDCPTYDFATHTRIQGHTEPLSSTGVLIVEGILALHYEPLRTLYDLGIYVHAPHDLCLTRRIHRDVQERGRTEASVRQQYWATARPMADLYVLPSREHAHVTVEGTDSLDWSVEQVLATLRAKRLV